MPFEFRDTMVQDYWHHGYAIFRDIIPHTLLRDMRVQADRAREAAHEINGRQTQRIQPIQNYPDRIDYKPFKDFAELPPLVDAIQRLLGPWALPVGQKIMGLLVEPMDRPRHGGWHRDGVCERPISKQNEPDIVEWKKSNWNRQMSGHQVNCAIYADSCLWYVPGSHTRWWDLPGEVQTFCYYEGKNPIDELTDLSNTELEAKCFRMCNEFPGAVNVQLQPGDYCVYKSNAWHTGVYLPYQPRATIHDVLGYTQAE